VYNFFSHTLTYTHTNMQKHAKTCISACRHSHTCTHAHMRTPSLAHTIHTHAHSSRSLSVGVFVCVRVECVCVYVCACVGQGVCMWVCARAHASMCVCVRQCERASDPIPHPPPSTFVRGKNTQCCICIWNFFVGQLLAVWIPNISGRCV